MIREPILNAPIEISGTISYSEQQPWIQNMTIRENILFGKDFDQLKYEEVLKAC